MNNSDISQGVYFLANNKVLDLTIAFLNSFRVHNKDLNLCFIPYDQDIEKILNLKDLYNFEIFENTALLNACDQISTKFHGNVVGAYRKLVVWEGIYDQFIYIDIDTIVLKNLSFVWKNLNHCKIFTSHSNLNSIRKWVWKDSIYEKRTLSNSQIEYSANTGFIVSTKKIIQMNWALDQVASALEFKEDMELLCMEQPFLNFLIVTSGYNYGSLLSFYNWDIMNGITTGIELEFWAGLPGGKIRQGKFKAPDNRPIFLIHWAGVWKTTNNDFDKIPYSKIWKFYRNLDPHNLCVLPQKKMRFLEYFSNYIKR